MEVNVFGFVALCLLLCFIGTEASISCYEQSCTGTASQCGTVTTTCSADPSNSTLATQCSVIRAGISGAGVVMMACTPTTACGTLKDSVSSYPSSLANAECCQTNLCNAGNKNTLIISLMLLPVISVLFMFLL